MVTWEATAVEAMVALKEDMAEVVATVSVCFAIQSALESRCICFVFVGMYGGSFDAYSGGGGGYGQGYGGGPQRGGGGRLQGSFLFVPLQNYVP